MKPRNVWMGITALAVGVALAAGSALAQEKKDEKKPGDKPATTPPPAAKPGDKPTAGQPSAEHDEMMKKMEAAATPGEFHKRLNALVGTWNCNVKFSHEPGGSPEESTGTLERKWILDGRYLMEEYKETGKDKPFSGVGYLGYDNLEKKYVGIWMDSMSTGIMKTTGTCDAAGKTFTFGGEYMCPVTGGPKKHKSTIEIVDNSKHIMRMYDTGPDGKEFQNFEMIATRK